MIYKYIHKLPDECTEEELAKFVEMVKKGDEVDPDGVEDRVKEALVLIYCYENESLVGIGALKSPRTSYRNKVFRKASSPELREQYKLELGWIFIEENKRGQGLSSAIVKEALRNAKGNGVFATTRCQNIPMRRTNLSMGFKISGKPFKSDRVDKDYLIDLFVLRPENFPV